MSLTSNPWLKKRVLPLLPLVVLAVLPAFGLQPNATRLLFMTLMWVTTSVAWNILGGFAGQVSFGFAVFYGVGAYTTAMTMNAGVNPYLAFLAGAATAAIASLIVGLPTFRLRGPYFAIATIGVTETVRVVATNLDFTGGASGYRILEHRAFHQVEHYYTALAMAALAVAIALSIVHAKFGLGLKAIAHDEDAAADIGINPFTYKLAAHALAAALTGLAGGVYARYAAFIHPNGVFGFQTSVQILLMPVIGGLGAVWGAVIGGVIFGIVEEEIVASFPQIHLLLYGSLLILIVLAEPGGILGAFTKLYRRIRDPRSRKPPDPASGEPDEVFWGVGSNPGSQL
jgi:branched-chain amino acid transport system permease protein